MWKGLSLRSRVIFLISLLLLIILAGNSVMIWYTYRLESLFNSFIYRDMATSQTISDLEIDLVNQKGLVSYYFMDGSPDWLKQLEEHRQRFDENFKRINGLGLTGSYKECIDGIEVEYRGYTEAKDRLIALYREGKREAGMKLHPEVRRIFFNIIDQFDNFKNLYAEKIACAHLASHNQVKKVRLIVGVSMVTATLLSIVLTIILMVQILCPVCKLSCEINRPNKGGKSENEIVVLKHQVHELIRDMEKFALVGKLAAGMAHSVRNPLASIKMRLFSMEQNLDFLPGQKADFEVIAEEIRHINDIIQQFLEFSRPPKLKMQKVSPSDIVDRTLLLLQNRLEAYGVKAELKRRSRLPEIMADPDQLKEVLVNLVVNACEAMITGGMLTIQEDEEVLAKCGRAVIIRICDNGVGIQESIKGKIFQPFFTSKEEGIGLGLTIAARILNEHGGWLDFTSKEGKGTVFMVILPLEKGAKWALF
ncbi:MAG: two-component system sensor histidine kinase NtrB [bacterium]